MAPGMGDHNGFDLHHRRAFTNFATPYLNVRKISLWQAGKTVADIVTGSAGGETAQALRRILRRSKSTAEDRPAEGLESAW